MTDLIPFLDLKAQALTIGSLIDVAITRAIGNERSAQRLEAGIFENGFAAYCSVGCYRAVSSGASALDLALSTVGVGPGDEVITVSMNFVAATAAIIRCGATPVFVDVDPVTWTMDPALIEAAITKRSKAIVPAHLHGLMADMDPIMAVARRHGLFVIEDAAAHGAEYKGHRAGSVGALGCFSFYPHKNLGAYGEAGAVVTDHPELALRVSRLLEAGLGGEPNHVSSTRRDAKMDEVQAAVLNIQAAVLNIKMGYIESWTEARRSIAAQYDRALTGRGLEHPRPPSHSRHVYHIYAVRLPRRDDALETLRGAGIGVGVHYAVSVHLQKRYVELGYRVGDLPVSERIASECLSLPIYPELPPDKVSVVAAELTKIAAPALKYFGATGHFRKMPQHGLVA